MRLRDLLALVLVVPVVALTACDEQPTSSPQLPGETELLPPVFQPTLSAPLERMEGYATPGESRTGYTWGPNGQPMEITYEIHDGLAIWEGDVILGAADEIPATREELQNGPPVSRGLLVAARGVVIDGAGFRWPGGVIPYVVDDPILQARVDGAIAIVEAQTAGVTLVPRTAEADYVRFQVGSGCSSAIGRQGNDQNINLAGTCSTGNAAHEILHALGMYHEHTRCDRDTFVQINDANIDPTKTGNFVKACLGATDIDAYDEGSMMHYGPFAFSINMLPTITSLRMPPRDDEMGQRAGLGPTDVITINQLYGANNVAPTADIAALDASYPEGSTVSFDGTGSSDPDDMPYLTYAWTFGDGTCTGGSPPAACTMPSPTHTYADDGAYPVTLTVNDGFLEDNTGATATIVNVDPVVDVGADDVVDEGSLFSQNGSFTDPGADSWTATVDYGEGAGPQALALAAKTFALSHTYVDNGSYTVTVEVTDDDGGVGSDQLTVTVNNVAPTVDAGPDAMVTSGEIFDFSGTFSDPGINDAPWAWLIEWGFGPDTNGSTDDQSLPITGSRQYCAAGDYTIQLSVTDKDGGTGMDAMLLTVPYLAIGIDIKPGSLTNPINTTKQGKLTVAILSSPTFDAAAIDPATLALGDENGSETPVNQKNNGSYQVGIEDSNGDGLMDMVAHFDVPSLVGNGDLDLLSTSLVLTGFLDDGCTNFRGEDVVSPH